MGPGVTTPEHVAPGDGDADRSAIVRQLRRSVQVGQADHLQTRPLFAAVTVGAKIDDDVACVRQHSLRPSSHVIGLGTEGLHEGFELTPYLSLADERRPQRDALRESAA